MRVRKTIAISLWIVSLSILLCGGVLVWVLKDGLGPDAIDSHGIAALGRFCGGMAWIVGIYVSPPLLIGCILYPWRNRRQ